MEGHAKKCVERYCELANKTTQQLYKVSTPPSFQRRRIEICGRVVKVCSQIVRKCLYLARIGRGLFQDSDFAGYLEDSKSSSGGTLCVFGSHTFVPISCLCEKRTSVSHSSTESEIISLDAGLRLDGKPALDIWNLIVAVLGNTNQSNKARGDLCTNQREVRSTPYTIQKRKQSLGVINYLDNVDLFPQTSIRLVRKLCCVCLRTTNQWSRWL